METTVTAVFPDEDQAQKAVEALLGAGFTAEQVEQVHKDTPNRHQLLGAETSDAARGAWLGAFVGGGGMGFAGVLMSVPPLQLFELHPVLGALVFGALGGVGGAVIGWLVGSGTGHQVQEEYETLLDEGGVLIAVNTDRQHGVRAREVLVAAGGRALSTSVHRRHTPASRTG